MQILKFGQCCRRIYFWKILISKYLIISNFQGGPSLLAIAASEIREGVIVISSVVTTYITAQSPLPGAFQSAPLFYNEHFIWETPALTFFCHQLRFNGYLDKHTCMRISWDRQEAEDIFKK